MSRLLMLCSLATLLAACLAPPRPRVAPAPPRAAQPPVAQSSAPPPTVVAPATPLPSWAERDAGEQEDSTVQEPEAVESPEASEPPLLAKIDASTPPNVAAALRLVEEGRAALEQQDYDRALDRLERALTIDPSSAYGYYFLARLHYERRGYDQAIAFADKAAALGARHDQGLSARALALEGAVFEQVGRYADARNAYRKALAADPQNLAARVGASRLSGGGTNP